MFNVNNKDTRITPINAFFKVFLMLTLNGKIFAGRDILSLPVVRLTNKTDHTQQKRVCSKLTTQTLEKGVKYLSRLTIKTPVSDILTAATTPERGF